MSATQQQKEVHATITLEEALAWIDEMFEEPVGTVRLDTPRDDIYAWDSLGQLVLMSKLDERFGVYLTEEDLPALQSVQDIIDILRRHSCLTVD